MNKTEHLFKLPLGNQKKNLFNRMKEVHINISGRIPNYVFGILEEDYYKECEEAIQHTSEEAETIADFVKMLYETTLDSGFEDGIEVFKANIDMDEFRVNCPLLAQFLADVEAGDASYYQFYERVLNISSEEVNIIEEDSFIRITVDGEEVVPKQKLADFLGETDWVDDEDYPEADAIVKAFWEKHNTRFGISEDTEDYTAYIAKNGVLQLSEWLNPKALQPYKVSERNVTIEHDNIVDFDYFFDTEDFSLSKLAFLLYVNVSDFHESAPEYAGSYLFYDNELIEPDINIHRDKGFTLEYESRFKSCEFLIEG